MTVSEVKFCDTCGKTVKSVSPPTTDEYKEGWIHVKEIQILLNNTRKKADHMRILENMDFCCIECLIKRLEKVRKWKNQQKPKS